MNAIAFESETALHLAAANGHHDVVRTLLSKGALVDAEDENSCTPLMFAALGNHPHSVKELLQHGANITRYFSETLSLAEKSLRLAENLFSLSTKLVGSLGLMNYLGLLIKASCSYRCFNKSTPQVFLFLKKV